MKQEKEKSTWEILKIDPYLQPFADAIEQRMAHYAQTKKRLLSRGQTLRTFASGSLYYGFHRTADGWVYREWAPHATALHLIGDFNGWNRTSHPLKAVGDGNWEIVLSGADSLPHESRVKVQVTADGVCFDRIPLYITRAVQERDGSFNGQIWAPPAPYRWRHKRPHRTPSAPLLIYECHVGMATERLGVGTFREFIDERLPYIRACGYNTIQLMAIMEHPYYASFGYQVSNFFAVSSRFGTPDELKELIDTAHGLGLTVLLDLVHSHAARNTAEGINRFDGTDYQFFHEGAAGDHPAWGTKLFDYGKPAVLHFLLSNLRFWLEEYRFDGFRFDGVTSMLYHDHALGECFDRYAKYFSANTDEDAVTYLQLANELIRQVVPAAVTIAEDMSGMPGMCLPIAAGGLGFDYRLAMGAPDFWIDTLHRRDEDWDMERLWYEMTTRRPQEKNIGYCESHDQALVGDKTIMFWLADQEMYWHMDKGSRSLIIDRAVALHKLIRLTAFSLSGEGYLNFMGNEFGHPEWIDFPREGNGDSYQYARRQWSLAQSPFLRYGDLLAFDRAMLPLAERGLFTAPPERLLVDNTRKLVVYRRAGLLFMLNFHPVSVQNVELPALIGARLLLRTDDAAFGGAATEHQPEGTVPHEGSNGAYVAGVAVPPRTGFVWVCRE